MSLTLMPEVFVRKSVRFKPNTRYHTEDEPTEVVVIPYDGAVFILQTVTPKSFRWGVMFAGKFETGKAKSGHRAWQAATRTLRTFKAAKS